MNSQSSGLVLAEGKLLLKVVQKLFAFCAALYLSACIWINMVCLEKIWFLGFWMKVLSTVWRAHLKWSSWMIQGMTLELSLAVWGELAVLWNYYGLVQLMSDEVVTWLQAVNGAHGVMLAGKKSQLKAWFFGTPEVKTEYFDYWWELCWTKLLNYSEHYRALWERQDHTDVNILEKSLKLVQVWKTAGKGKYLEIIMR